MCEFSGWHRDCRKNVAPVTPQYPVTADQPCCTWDMAIKLTCLFVCVCVCVSCGTCDPSAGCIVRAVSFYD